MTDKIETQIQVLDKNSRMRQILHYGKATRCSSSSPAVCGMFLNQTHQVARGDDQEIIPEGVHIGLCGLTGVACLKAAKIIALELLPL